jgi:phage gp29-like protein
LYGTYPSNWGEENRQELLTSLKAMIADAVAIIPEGADAHIEALANKGSVSNIHAEYISAANSELSKAVWVKR